MIQIISSAFARGHEIVKIKSTGQWHYSDDLSIFDDSRPCAHCGEFATPEGFDACLGFVPGAVSACCGHGIGPESIVYSENQKDEFPQLELKRI